jgi:hypothetical protein
VLFRSCPVFESIRTLINGPTLEQVKALVNAAHRGLSWVTPTDPDAEIIRAALKPFEKV